jgi:hypothetical protein
MPISKGTEFSSEKYVDLPSVDVGRTIKRIEDDTVLSPVKFVDDDRIIVLFGNQNGAFT